METAEYIAFSLLAATCIIGGIFINGQLGVYVSIIGIVIIVFIIYLKIKDTKEGFDFNEFDEQYLNDLIHLATRQFDAKIKEIYLTGEDLLPMRKIGDCCGIESFSLDIYPPKHIQAAIKGEIKSIPVYEADKKEAKEFLAFFYYEYSTFFLRNLIQQIIPRIPIINNIIYYIPFISSFFFPAIRGVVAPRSRCRIKTNTAEIDAKSLIPMQNKKSWNVFSVVEYEGKSDTTREAELFIFEREIMKDTTLQMLNAAKNTMDIGVKLNPASRLEQERSITRSK